MRVAEGAGERPVLDDRVWRPVNYFLAEREAADALLAEGILPPSKILLTGPPGTGKTMLARWIAGRLGMPISTLDLSTSISSLLGKTGFNLRRTLDYARSTPCLLLFDEFDAVAKRRDDGGEIGELKRIVNVLLKELEDWPPHSVLVGATNHPELLDRAVRRRFDLTLELPLPGKAERAEILRVALDGLSRQTPDWLVTAVAAYMDGASGSDVGSTATAAARGHVVRGIPIETALAEAVTEEGIGSAGSRRSIGPLVRAIKEASDLPVRRLAEIFGRSPSTIQKHLTSGKQRGRRG